jgi:hypothetical protein
MKILLDTDAVHDNVMMRMFPLTLEDEASDWFDSYSWEKHHLLQVRLKNLMSNGILAMKNEKRLRI